MNNKVIVIGSSGHAKICSDIIESNGYYIVGLIDSYRNLGDKTLKYDIISNDINNIDEICKTHNTYNIFIAIGDNYSRYKVQNTIKKFNLNYPTFIHSSAVVSKYSNIGCGSIIMPNVTINTNTDIQNFCVINTNSSIDHDCKIGNFTSIAPGVTLGGNVNIGSNTFIGIGSTVIHKINIGDNVLIGSSSNVVNNIDSNKTYYGNPAKFIKDRKIDDKFL